MEIEDIDAWYEEQKENLTEAYHQKLKKADERFKLISEDVKAQKKRESVHDSIKRGYLASMKRLHQAYENKSKHKLDSNLAGHFKKHRFDMWKKDHLKFFDRLKEKLKKKEKQK